MNFNDHDTKESASDQTSPDEAGSFDEFGDQDFGIIDGEAPRKKLNSGVLIVIIVILVAAAGLFSMRTLTRATAAGPAPTEIEQLVEQFLPSIMKKGGNTGRSGVISVLNESYAERQVPLDDVQRNPFIIFEDKAEGDAPVVSATDPIETRRKARISQFEQAGNKLRIGMILMGAQPLANINNKIVRIGETVQVEPTIAFRVVNIASNQVDLVAEDAELGVRVVKTLILRRD